MSVQNLGRVTGMSAYEIAVQQGFVGDENAWLASLKGETGATGATGAEGFSPIATVSKTGSVATITITDENGTTTASVYDGSTASLVAGTGIDITGDTITNTMPYDDAATASYIFNNFGMSVTTTSTLETATAPISEGSATVSLFWNRWVKPALSVYIDNTLIDTIEAEDWVYDSQTDYNTASLTGGGSISHDQHNIQFLVSGVSGDEVKLEYTGTSVTRTPLDDLYIDNTIARTSDIPTPDGTTITTSGNVWSATFTETDPVFSASPAATITASDISNWNSIDGVPTYSAADDGKALVVTSSGTALGWDTVGGGGGGIMIITVQGSFASASALTADEKAAIASYYTNPSSPTPLMICDSSNREVYLPAGCNGNTIFFTNLSGNKYCRAIYHLTEQTITLFVANQRDFNGGIKAANIGLSRFSNPDPTATSSTYLDNGMKWIHNNFPVADGSSLTTSGYTWSVANPMPACPTTTDGAYVLKATVSDGAVTYEWVAQS